jgi:hypothetical protein
MGESAVPTTGRRPLDAGVGQSSGQQLAGRFLRFKEPGVARAGAPEAGIEVTPGCGAERLSQTTPPADGNETPTPGESGSSNHT